MVQKKIWVTSSGGPLVHWSAHTQLETCLHYFALSLNLIFMHGGHVGILKFAREIIGWPGCVRSPQSANPEYRKKRFVAFKVVYISFIFISNFSILFCLLLKSNIVLSSKFEYFLSLKHFRSNLTSVSSPSPRKKDNASQKMKAKKDIDIQMPWSGFNILNVGLLNDHDGFF